LKDEVSRWVLAVFVVYGNILFGLIRMFQCNLLVISGLL